MKQGEDSMGISNELLNTACNNIKSKFEKIPFKIRGIVIYQDIIKRAIELLNRLKT